MNKKLYTLLGHIPIVGMIIQAKTNFFAFKPSPFLAEFTKTKNYQILNNWLKNHPNQVISPKKAKELINKSIKQK